MKGTHGTSRSKASSIQNDGFNISPGGRRGSGAYFWGYSNDAEYAIALAKQWWAFADKKNKYEDDEDGRCSVILATIEVEESYILNFEDQVVRDSFIEYGTIYYNGVDGDKFDKISKIYDMFIADLEKEEDTRIKLVCVKLQQPNGFNNEKLGFLPLDITGHPLCYVVKDKDCINIDNIND